jgi:hypothetical protein
VKTQRADELLALGFQSVRLVFRSPLHAYLSLLSGDFLGEILDELKPRDAHCKVATVDTIKLKLRLLNKETLPVDNTGLFYDLLYKYLECHFPDLHLTPQEILSESITTHSQSVRVDYRIDEKSKTPIVSLIKYGSDSQDSNTLLSIRFDKHGFASIVEGKDKENDSHINEIIEYAKFFSRGWMDAQECLECFRNIFDKNGKSDYSIKRSEYSFILFEVRASLFHFASNWMKGYKGYEVQDDGLFLPSKLLSFFLRNSVHQYSEKIPYNSYTLTYPECAISNTRSLQEERRSYLEIQRQSSKRGLLSILKKIKKVITNNPTKFDIQSILERFNEMENRNRVTTKRADNLRPVFLHLFEGRNSELYDSSQCDDFIIPMNTWVNALDSIIDLNCNIHDLQNCLLALQAKKDAQFEEITSEISDVLKLFIDHFLEETDLSKVEIILHMLSSKKKILKIFGCELYDLLFESQHPLRLKGGQLSDNPSSRGTFIPDEKYALRCILQLCCYEKNPDISNCAWLSVTDLPFNDTLVSMLHDIYHSGETSDQLKNFLHKNILSRIPSS